MKVRDEKLKAIIDWSENNRDIRAVLLTSSPAPARIPSRGSTI